MNKVQMRDPDTGIWYGIVDGDVIVENKDPEFVAGVLESYEENILDLKEVYKACELYWKSDFGAEQELYLQKVLMRIHGRE